MPANRRQEASSTSIRRKIWKNISLSSAGADTERTSTGGSIIHSFYKHLAALLEEHSTLAIATITEVTGSVPRHTAAKMIVLPDGTIHGAIGGGGMEKMLIEDALELMKTGGSCQKSYNLAGKKSGGIGPICGGEATVFIEIVRAPETLLLCGGGHIAAAMAPMARLLGMNLIVVDSRAEFASRERFPKADRVINTHPGDPAIKELVTASTWVVIFTHNHEHDTDALKNLIDSGAAYIGMIGSRKKVKEVLTGLASQGVPAEALSRVYSPVGLDIGAETPAEIAVSILAEIIHVKRTGSPSPVSMKRDTFSETAKK
jgi:xanthine dehydrogenase accessory factor